ncbi:MAG: transcription elongation factor GreA [Clostridiales bacterium]|jgi:transcription elongation factor GreA|nr:transcription elongation factor GreA [Clostridiales bacterium]
MSEKKIVLTYDGLKALENELQDLKINRRKEVAEKIKEARGQGDLSENAEYDSAKEEQAEIEARIAHLEKMLRNAEVIDEEEINKEVVSVGGKVTILDMEYNDEMVFTIVGSAEADPAAGKISNESPLGVGLLGHKVNDIVDVEAPEGVVQYKIQSIQ